MSAMCQKRKSPASFDHLVGELLEMQRHVEAQRLGGLEIDDQLKLKRFRAVPSFERCRCRNRDLWQLYA
jgi:hypothetical protein